MQTFWEIPVGGMVSGGSDKFLHTAAGSQKVFAAPVSKQTVAVKYVYLCSYLHSPLHVLDLVAFIAPHVVTLAGCRSE